MKGYFKTIISTVLCYVIVVSTLSSAAVTGSAASYTGAGTETNPYMVSSGAELMSVLELYNAEGVYIKLDNNITLTDTYVPGEFLGNLDGDFYKITAVTPFFNCNSGTLKNFYYNNTVTITDGDSSYAGVVCNTNGGVISGVIATGNIDCSCYHTSSGDNDVSAPDHVGIIAGRNSGTIINCAAFGSVKTDCEYGCSAGGITSGGGTVYNCYVSATVSAVGGGRYGSGYEYAISGGTSSNCYYNSELFTATGSGGFTAADMKKAQFVTTLNSGTESADCEWVQDTSNKNSGFPILKRALNCKITSSKTNVIIDGTETVTLTGSDSSATIYYTTNGTTPTTSSSRYTGPITISNNVTIKAVAYKNGLYGSVVTFSYCKPQGEGTKSNPYVINCSAAFYAMTELENDAHYVLSKNITLDSEIFSLEKFCGSLDGCGYKVSGVYTDTRVWGFIKENYGVVKNLTFEVKANSEFKTCAGFVANNRGVVYNCHFKGNINSEDLEYEDVVNTGGLVSNNYGRIEKSSFEGGVYSENSARAGGVVGYNAGDVLYCSFDGEVDIYAVTFVCKQGYVGGFVGYTTSDSSIKYCDAVVSKVYSSPANYSGVYVGGFTGLSNTTAIVDCTAQIGSVSYSYFYTEWGYNETNYYTGVTVLGYKPAAHAHEYNVELQKPECGEYRKAEVSCGCGVVIASEWYDAEWSGKQHNFGNNPFVISVAPTCTEPGEARKQCTACDYYDTMVIPATEHRGVTTMVDKALYPESTHNTTGDSTTKKTFTYEGANSLMLCFSPLTRTHSGDYIYIYDKNDKVIGSYSGSNLSGKNIAVEGDTFKIKISPNTYESSYYGYSFDAILAYTNGDKVLESSRYPESAHNYADSLDQTKVFTEPGASSLKVTFSTQTFVENNYDNIYIYDKNDNQIGKYTGSALAGVTITIPGDTFKIRLTSDSSVNKYGYSITSISVEGGGYGDWTVTQAPTCIEAGEKERTCSMCSYVDTTSVAALGHSFTNYIYDYNQTYTENGTQTAKCDRCSETHRRVVENTKIAPVSIEIADLPDKLSYVVGGSVAVEGLTFVAKYADYGEYTFGAEAVETVTADLTTAGVTKATITYMGCTAEFDIYVHESAPVLVDSSLYPESSHNYANNTNQTKNFTYTGATELIITFSSSTFVENNYDYIYIYNKNGSLYGKYTSNQLAGKTITLPGDAFKIILTSDSSNTNYGYKINSIYADGPFSMYHPEIVIPATATCTQDGLTQGSYCEICGDIVIEPVETEAFGHSFAYYVSDANSTCVADGTKTAQCNRCGVTDTVTDEGSMKPHDCDTVEAKAPTCTEIGWDSYEVCKDCDYTTYSELPATNHLDKIFTEQQDPTCTVEGYAEGYYCPDCEIWVSGHDTIAPTEHPEQYIVGTVKATCTEDGYSIGLYCPDCEEWLMGHELIPATGHALVNHEAKAPSCTEIGWEAYETCSNCDYTTYEEIAALGHDEISHDAQAPTCTEIGWNEYVTCSRCDYSTYEEIAENGHTLVEHEAKTPTCTEIGWAAYNTCEVCSYTTYEEIAACGHAFVEHEAQAPTCTEIGWNAYTSCENCDYSTFVSIAATKHKRKMLADEVEPTCDTVGYTAGMFCNDCGEWLMGHEEVPAKGHKYTWVNNEAELTKTGTCSECGDVISEAMISADVITFTLNAEGTAYKAIDCLNNYVGEIEIPEEYKGLPVTEIAADAFLDCTGISAAVIPAGVIIIGDRALGYYNSADGSLDKTEGFVIYGEEGSAAQAYAVENGFEFILITERDKAIYGTVNTKVDYDSFIIRTIIQCGNNIKDILGISKNADIEVNGSYKYGDTELYGTGSVISVYDGESIVGEYTLVVDGDTNGDSVCDVLDCVDVERATSGREELVGAYALAADTNSDDVIDVNDYQAIINKAV